MLVLVPVGVVVAVAAGPIVRLLTGAVDPRTVAVGAGLLRIFAVQVPLYGVGVVLTGILQAHHRYGWPVLAPLLSSITVIATYLTFASVVGTGVGLGQLSPAGASLLGWGTTAGVAVLTLSLLVPVRRLGVVLRPRLAMGAGVARRVGGLAGASVFTVLAQQAVTAWLIRVANAGPAGTVVLFTLAQAVFTLPLAVLILPVSVPAFTHLAATDRPRTGDPSGDRRAGWPALEQTTRIVLLAGGLGAALLAGGSRLVGRVLGAVVAVGRPEVSGAVVGRPPAAVVLDGAHSAAAVLTAAVVAFAPGVLGLAAVALLSRVLLARGRPGGVAASAVLGAVATIAAAGLVGHWSRDAVVVTLAVAVSLGTLAQGAALVVLVAGDRSAGRGAWTRAVARGLLVAVGGAVVAGGVARAVPDPVVAVVAAGVIYLVVAVIACPGDVRSLWGPAVPGTPEPIRAGTP